ncbi:MAG: type II secretion system F family protein [Candidatus Diapherotrites archaeon]|nr:type II secretion system F family protein [Candidatus Diapherotrites archaeon]
MPIKKDKPELHDMEKVDAIVEKMKKKYASEGIEVTPGQKTELTSLITEGKVSTIEVQRPEDLKEHESKFLSFVGKTYTGPLRGFLDLAAKIFSISPFAQALDAELYSANMKLSARQWLIISSAVSFFMFFAVFFAGLGFLSLFKITTSMIPLVLVLSFVFSFFTGVITLMIPKFRAKSRGKAISMELPFALRHIATQLSAGIGLYRTLQAVAKADYGPLSEEFARTITEIEEGMDTQEALRRLALRTKSVALKNAMMHTIRAIKTGGNLSNVMNEIAEDVAFQLRSNMQEFGQKMNFIGVLFIFFAIVFPVVIAILGAIRNSPISAVSGKFTLSMLPLGIDMLAIFYLMLMPLLLIMVFTLIRSMQPHA